MVEPFQPSDRLNKRGSNMIPKSDVELPFAALNLRGKAARIAGDLTARENWPVTKPCVFVQREGVRCVLYRNCSGALRSLRCEVF